MILHIDSQARLQILQALKNSTMGDVYALISLHDGYELLFLAHAGNIAFCLVDDLGDLLAWSRVRRCSMRVARVCPGQQSAGA